MMRNKFSWTMIVVLVFALKGMGQSDVSKSRWNNQKIIVDGNDQEWTKPLNFYDDKSGLIFAISNDSTNLYFVFTVNDQKKMERLMAAGWMIQLSSKAKGRKFNTQMVFPAIKGERSDKRSGNKKDEKDEKDEKLTGDLMIDAYRSQLQSIALKGFLSNQGEAELNDAEGIDITVGTGSSRFILYEMAIPLAELIPDSKIQYNELITLCVTANAMSRNSEGGGRGEGGQDNASGGMSGGPQGGGMGGGPQGGMGGGPQGGMGGGQQSGMSGGQSGGMSSGNSGSMTRATFKQKFTLAKN